MLRKNAIISLGIVVSLMLTSVSCTLFCKQKMADIITELSVSATVFPDYADTLILPPNIAPLDFRILSDSFSSGPYCVRLYVQSSAGELTDSLHLETKRFVRFSLSSWQRCLKEAAMCEGNLIVNIFGQNKEGNWVKYAPKIWRVVSDSIDPYLVYRVGPYGDNPGHNLQICERSLSDFSQRILMDNRFTDYSCMNCHTNSNNNSQKLMIHLRWQHAGTLIIDGEKTWKIAIPEGYPDLRLVYPSWSRDGRYIAFASPRIQAFYYANKFSTQDIISDTLGKILLYDLEENRLFSCPELTDDRYEFSFPAWNPDGNKLYFCRADKTQDPKDFKYNLCVIDFNTKSQAFGKTKLVHNFKADGKSVSIPQVHPDGRYILTTTLPSGSFPAHNLGDLSLTDLWTGKVRDVDELNTPDSERYHHWSSNGRWVVFGSQRTNGGTALIYISYFDCRGRFSTPFVLPQNEDNFYLKNTRSFLFPTLSRTKAPMNLKKWEKAAKEPAVAPDMSYFKEFYHAGQNTPESGH